MILSSENILLEDITEAKANATGRRLSIYPHQHVAIAYASQLV